MNTIVPDPWERLRRHTAARIALGRAGASLPTAELLRFALDHALAIDAVHTELDVERLESDLVAANLGLDVIHVATRIADRPTYLQRPDWGRELADADHGRLLEAAPSDGFDLSIMIADGLSAEAAQSHAPPLLGLLVPSLRGLRLAPLVIARYGRVALQDDVGVALRARCSLILLGERPGLGTPDSLGGYLVFRPRPGNTDADRNCVSNIRPAGLPIPAAAETLRYLVTESLRRQISGVALKDDRPLSRELPG